LSRIRPARIADAGIIAEMADALEGTSPS